MSGGLEHCQGPRRCDVKGRLTRLVPAAGAEGSAEARKIVGEVLAGLVNFFNPDTVVMGGTTYYYRTRWRRRPDGVVGDLVSSTRGIGSESSKVSFYD